MVSEEMFADYVAAFNRGDTDAYGAFYAPGVIFRNGAGVDLQGPRAIISFYEALNDQMTRELEVRCFIPGERALCAALHSHFRIVAQTAEFSGRTLARGDEVLLDSVALYELEGNRFGRIEARTLSRQFVLAGGRQ